jgi:hypothetical protein
MIGFQIIYPANVLPGRFAQTAYRLLPNEKEKEACCGCLSF